MIMVVLLEALTFAEAVSLRTGLGLEP